MKTLLLSIALITTPAAADPAASPAHLLAESRAALTAKDAKRAVALAEQAVAAEPNNPELQAHLGHAYSMRIGEVSFVHQATMSGKMLGAYQRAVELDPDHLGGRIGLARYYTYAPAIAGGSRQKAEAQAKEIRGRHPYLGALEAGIIAEHFNDLPAAVAAYLEARALAPDEADVHERLGRVHARLGDTRQAQESFSRCLELDPERARVREALNQLSSAAPQP